MPILQDHPADFKVALAQGLYLEGLELGRPLGQKKRQAFKIPAAWVVGYALSSKMA